MPLYEYQCSECNHRFESLAKSCCDPDPLCPKCEGDQVRKLMSAGCVRPNGIPKGAGGFSGPPPGRGCGGKCSKTM